MVNINIVSDEIENVYLYQCLHLARTRNRIVKMTPLCAVLK